MQEEIQFLHQPELEYEKLSASSEYFRLLNDFNEKYDIDLDYTPKARWKPGTYDKIKNKMRDIEYPHWKNKRGANNLRKLFEVQSWNRRGFVDGLHKLDDMMANYRYDGINLVDGDLIEQGKQVVEDSFTSLARPINDVSVRILPFRLWNRQWYEDSPITEHIPYCPTLNPISLDIDTSIDGENMNKLIFNPDQDIWKDKNPSHWFVNIIVKLPDVNLRCYKNTDIGEQPDNCILEQPYGHLVLGITISLFDYCMGRRAAMNNTKMSRWTKNISMFAYQMPIIDGTKHPFVYKPNRDNTTVSYNSRQYGMGNICLGEWHNDIIKQLFYGNLGIMRALLRSWSEIYYVNNTGPLNTLYMSFVGNSKSWSDEVRADIGISPTTCESVLKWGMENQTLLDNHCADCTLSADLSCKVYRKLTKKMRELPGEFAEWALAKAQPSITMAQGLKAIYTKLYNMQMDGNPEGLVQKAFFHTIPSDIKGHMANGWWDDHFNDLFRSMQTDGYCIPEEHLNIMYEVAERMFYQHRIHTIYMDYAIGDAVYQRYCADTQACQNLIQANTSYPLEDMKTALNTMMLQAGTAVVDNGGRFALTSHNNFNQYIKYIGGLDEW